jgi:cell division protein FtsB
MTGLQASAPRHARSQPPIRLRLPIGRPGLTWMAVLALIGLFVAVQVGREVYSSWSISQDADRIQAQIVAMEARNEALRQELAYVNSSAYISSEARRLFNLGRSGEQVLIIPPGREVALSPDLQAKLAPLPKPLLEQWLDLFFGP